MMRRGTRCVVLGTTRGFRSQELWLRQTFLDWLLGEYPHVVAVECGLEDEHWQMSGTPSLRVGQISCGRNSGRMPSPGCVPQ
jgi:hypothetical protein